MKDENNNAKFRKKVIEYSYTHSIKAASKKYDVSIASIYNWRNKYKESGEEGLTSKSRAHHTHPLKTPSDEEKIIRQFVIDNADLPYPKIEASLYTKKGIKKHFQTIRNIYIKSGHSKIKQKKKIKELKKNKPSNSSLPPKTILDISFIWLNWHEKKNYKNDKSAMTKAWYKHIGYETLKDSTLKNHVRELIEEEFDEENTF